jgi:flagellar biosynthesis/type III secretory pathway protein FliH
LIRLAEAKWSGARDEFMAFTAALRSAQSQKNDFYQPLKKLALHLAEQLVRGELNQSTAVIERLLEEAIKDIEEQGEGPITVHLNASDHQQFTAHLSSDLDHLSLHVDSSLRAGSVRITMGDSAVEDLIETRLSALSERLLGLPEHRSAPRSVAKSYRDARTDAASEASVIIEGSVEELGDSDDIIETESPDV